MPYVATNLVSPLRWTQPTLVAVFWLLLVCSCLQSTVIFRDELVSLDFVEIIHLVGFILGNHLSIHWSYKMIVNAELRKWEAAWMCFLLHVSFSLKKTPRPLNWDTSTKMLGNFTEESTLCIAELPRRGHMLLQDVGVVYSFINMESES